MHSIVEITITENRTLGSDGNLKAFAHGATVLQLKLNKQPPQRRYRKPVFDQLRRI